NLAEKFQAEIKSHFPLIDHVGIVLGKSLATKEEGFSIKKIKLH
ncbi:MAG: hypothetical protein UT76_C0013G0013, partial [Candidatus Woesebacteria bacterium GW2011_GWB1_40_12]